MFAADRAPNWSDGDNCHRCRVQFSVIVRKVLIELIILKRNITILLNYFFPNCSIIVEHVDKFSVVNAPLVAAHYRSSALKRKFVFAKIASTNTTRNTSALHIKWGPFPYKFPSSPISDGRSGRDESDSTSKPTEVKAEKSRKEEELKLQEEEELQLAIALSRSEVEHKKESGKMHTQRTYSSPVKVRSIESLKYDNNM